MGTAERRLWNAQTFLAVRVRLKKSNYFSGISQKYYQAGPLRSAKSVSKPCSAPKASRKAKVARVLESTDLGFSRALPKARLTYLLQLDCMSSRLSAVSAWVSETRPTPVLEKRTQQAEEMGAPQPMSRHVGFCFADFWGSDLGPGR